MSLDALIDAGRAALGRGDLASAAQSFEAAVATHPDHAEALHGLGVTHLQSGQVQSAVVLIRKAIARDPRANYYTNLSFALLAAREPAEALWAAQRAVERDPAAAVARANLGAALAALERFSEAEAAFRAALDRASNLLAAQVGLGSVLLRQQRPAEALPWLQAATKAAPRHAEALLNLGVCLEALKQSDEAAAALTAALEARPDWDQAVLALAKVEAAREHFPEAIALYRRAVAAYPAAAALRASLAGLLSETGALDDALALYDEAEALDPDLADVPAGRGVAHLRNDALGLAEAELDRAIALTPDWPEARFARALVYLKQGRYAEGWPEYEWRLKLPGHGWSGEDLPQPRWDGGDLAGKTLFLHAEQGLGDVIQCARFIPELLERGASVIMRAPRGLRPILKPLGVSAFVGEAGDPTPPYDVHLPLFSLPLILGVRLPTIVGAKGYVSAAADLAAQWAKRLPQGLRVGLVWQGSFGSKVDRGRSLHLADLAPLGDIPGGALISLQKGHGLDQLAACDLQVADLGEAYAKGDFTDTAAIIANLDLVIACDTSVAHLAGALGKPVWIALAKANDWRWLTERSDSPWYASARLYRQAMRDDWAAPVAAMARDLAKLAMVTPAT
jgi:tetratricopeptide (TPR) repeat protein